MNILKFENLTFSPFRLTIFPFVAVENESGNAAIAVNRNSIRHVLPQQRHARLTKSVLRAAPGKFGRSRER